MAATRAQVASLSMAHWTALRTVSTGDVGLCGGTEAWLALLNFGEYCILRGASAVDINFWLRLEPLFSLKGLSLPSFLVHAGTQAR